MDEKTMVITDSEGNEHNVTILFTYDNEERGTSYVFFYEDNDPDEVLVYRVTKDNELEEIDDDEEYEEVEEVFNAYQEDPKIQDLKTK